MATPTMTDSKEYSSTAIEAKNFEQPALTSDRSTDDGYALDVAALAADGHDVIRTTKDGRTVL